MAKRNGRYSRPPWLLTHKRVRAILVEDALAGVFTPEPWNQYAYQRLGKAYPGGPDEALRDVVAEVRSKGGAMPMAPGYFA